MIGPNPDQREDHAEVGVGICVLLFAMVLGFICGMMFGCATVQGAALGWVP
jgi:hypothetical protein